MDEINYSKMVEFTLQNGWLHCSKMFDIVAK
jgi:hypothetical protein